jgi:hypothetical protein
MSWSRLVLKKNLKGMTVSRSKKNDDLRIFFYTVSILLYVAHGYLFQVSNRVEEVVAPVLGEEVYNILRWLHLLRHI